MKSNSKSFKIASKFYVIYGDGVPIYVGYTNRSVKQRFAEHKHDKDFSEYDSVESIELKDQRMSFDFTWDYNETCKNAENVSEREKYLVNKYCTQDTCYQKAIGGGQTWAFEKWFVKTNHNNPKFKGLPTNKIRKIINEQKILSMWIYDFIHDICPQYQTDIKNFIRHIEFQYRIDIFSFINNIESQCRTNIGIFVNNVKLQYQVDICNFVNHIEAQYRVDIKSLIGRIEYQYQVDVFSFINRIGYQYLVDIKHFINHIEPQFQTDIRHFINHIEYQHKIDIGSFVGRFKLQYQVDVKNFVGHIKLREIKNE